MNMQTYYLSCPLAFLIDEEVAAHINKEVYLRSGMEIPSEVQTLIDSGRFSEAAKDIKNEALNNAGFFDIHMAVENIGLQRDDIDCVLVPEFEGWVNRLSTNGHPIESRKIDDTIAYIEAIESPSPFKAAYKSMQEFVQEIRQTFKGTGFLPDGLKIEEHVVEIHGTYSV